MSIILQLAMSLVWLTALALIMVRTPHSSSTLYRLQALGEAAVAATFAVYMHVPWLWLSVSLVVIIKMGLVPRIIGSALPKSQPYGGSGPLGMSSILFIALMLTALGIVLGHWGFSPTPEAGLVLASLFVAFLHLSSRYEIWSLAWGLLSLDTVCGVAALLLPTHLPEVIEVGIYTASLVLALILAYLLGRIGRVKHTMDVREMEDLIG